MRLRFSRTADYALRAALEVARAPAGRLVSRQSIADGTDARLSVVTQSLAALVRAGVLVGQAGPGGGYRLARAASLISVFEVVMAVDGEPREERCVLHEKACSWTGACPFHAVLAAAQDRFYETLRSTSLADVASGATTVSGRAPDAINL